MIIIVKIIIITITISTTTTIIVITISPRPGNTGLMSSGGIVCKCHNQHGERDPV